MDLTKVLSVVKSKKTGFFAAGVFIWNSRYQSIIK